MLMYFAWSFNKSNLIHDVEFSEKVYIVIALFSMVFAFSKLVVFPFNLLSVPSYLDA